MQLSESEIIAKRQIDYQYTHIYTPFMNFGQSILISRQHHLFEQPYCECMDFSESCKNDECTNVQGRTHCSPRCSPQCQNSWADDINPEKWMELFVLGTQNIGVGVRAKTKIKRGLIVAEYVGEFICSSVYEERRRNEYINRKHFYGMFVDKKLEVRGDRGTIMDATTQGNITRFVNHCSRVPNLEVEIWHYNGFPRIYFRTLYDIPKGAELTFDYRAVSFDENWNPEVCLCSNCTQNMNATPFIPTLSNTSTRKTKEPTPVPERTIKTRSATSKTSLESVQVPTATINTPPRLDAQNTTSNAGLSDVSVAQSFSKKELTICDICDKQLSRGDSIFRHKKFVHYQNYSAIQCGVCPVSFSQVTNFKLHMKTYHPNVRYELPKTEVPIKRFKCSQCVRSYDYRQSLKRHMISCRPIMKVKSTSSDQ